MFISRRHLLAGLAAVPTAALAQHQAHRELFSNLKDVTASAPPAGMDAQRYFHSSAPRAKRQGRWVPRARLPLPRSEMAWAAELDGRMHLIGGYGEQAPNRTYHQAYDPGQDRWLDLAPLPMGANHIGVAALDGRIYAVGGFIEQNKAPHSQVFVWDAAMNRWSKAAPLSSPRGAISAVALGGRIHAIGGRDSRSVETHEIYDPKLDRWDTARPLAGHRDHIGAVAVNDAIHAIGGRKDTFDFNTPLHLVYDPRTDRWEERAPMPTPRSGHGAVWYRDRIFCFGGKGTQRVFGNNEAYDPATDRWEAHAPMPTPRHGLGAAAIGDWIYVAGGGPVEGGGTQTAFHEAFTLG